MVAFVPDGRDYVSVRPQSSTAPASVWSHQRMVSPSSALVKERVSWTSWRNLRREHEVARELFMEEQPIRLIAKMLITGIILFAGFVVESVMLSVPMFGTEVIGGIMARRRLPSERTARARAMLFGFWAVLIVSNIALVLPAVLLGSQGSMPLFVIGGLWNLGLIFYVSIHFGTMPVHNLVSLGVMSATTFAVLWFAMTGDYLRGNWGEVALSAAFLIAYNVVALHTLLRQNRISLALQRAKAEAEARLAQIEYIARHDELTGLFNRRSFDEALAMMLRECSEQAPLWAIMVDLNNFKPVNDLYSHDTGDEVLRQIARRLSEFAVPDGVVARIGGDEFLLALPGRDADEEAQALLNAISARLSAPIAFDRGQLCVTAALGLAKATGPDMKVSLICAQADQAMYRSKNALDGRPAIYSPEWIVRSNPLAQRTVLLEAFRAGEIVPYFQPKIDMRSGGIIGFEALARWVRPEGDVLPPSRFLPAIEEAGLGGELVNHVAACVVEQVRVWHQKGFCPRDISINVSEVTLATESGCGELLAILDDLPDRKHLTLEITEDVFFARSADPVRCSIERLRAAGCRISLDDFGTGYASFRHLRELEFDEVKIDRSFTSDLGRDRSADVLVEAVISIAESLGLQVIAEGIETEEQRQRLMAMGCRAGQGYLWNRALSAQEVDAQYVYPVPTRASPPVAS